MNPVSNIPPEALLELGRLAFYSITVCVVAVAVLGCIAFWKSENSAGSFTRMFERAQALKMVTVLLIVLSVLILALVGKIAESGAVGVLSGIAGYVLGGLEKQPAEAAKAGESAKVTSVDHDLGSATYGGGRGGSR